MCTWCILYTCNQFCNILQMCFRQMFLDLSLVSRLSDVIAAAGITSSSTEHCFWFKNIPNNGRFVRAEKARVSKGQWRLNVPVQMSLFSINLEEQVHIYEPSVFWQTSLLLHMFVFSAHSSISVKQVKVHIVIFTEIRSLSKRSAFSCTIVKCLYFCQ